MNKPTMTQLEIISEIRKGTECTLERARDLSMLLSRYGVLTWRQPFQAEEGDTDGAEQSSEVVVVHSHPKLESLLERIASTLEAEQAEPVAAETDLSDQDESAAQKAS